MPLVIIFKTSPRIVIRGEVSSLEQEALSVEVNVQHHIVKGEHALREETGRNYPYVERPVGSFRRTFAWPMMFCHEQCQVLWKNGVLAITLTQETTAKPAHPSIEAVKTVLSSPPTTLACGTGDYPGGARVRKG
jgi:HSP20 family molecular chaperone IbpA